MHFQRAAFIGIFAASLLEQVFCAADDWPQWRRDAQRSGATAEELPVELHLLWKRQFATPRPAWPEVPRLLFDRSYEPVVLGKTMFVPGNVDDSLTALDIESGKTRWQFFADGPIRFAPAAGSGKVYFGSDDGHLYCLNADDGKLLWKLRGGPSDRKVFGNDRLISMWPVRGGPVLDEGRVYFTAGIWPFMGIFAHALDAETGKVIWTNDTTGEIFIGGKGGVGASPQGYLTVKRREQLAAPDRPLGDVVIAPCGGSTPVLFDRDSGQLKHFGGFVPYFADEDSKARYKSVKNFGFKKGGAGGWFVTSPTVLSDEYQPYEVEIRVGSRTINAENCPPVEDEVTSLLAADGKLFVVNDRGAIYCFGGEKRKVARDGEDQEGAEGKPAAPDGTQAACPAVDEILAATKVKRGVGACLILGAGDGELVEALIRKSTLDCIVLESDLDLVAKARRRANGLSMYGSRVHILPGELESAALPPYMAKLVVVHQARATHFSETFVKRLFKVLRPYGAAAALRCSAEQHAALEALVEIAALPKAKLRRAGAFSYLSREGPLPDSGSWTHEHGDAGNTLFSPDGRVRSPLGILWFGGGSSSDGVFQNDPVLVAGGRMFLYTRRRVTAVDVYTGRVLWKDGPRAGGPLPCYAAAADGYYSAGVNKQGLAHIVMLDVETGQVAGEVELSKSAGPIKEIRVWQDILIATTPNRILAFDRRDLTRLWQRDTAADVVPRLKVGYGKWRGGPANHGLCVGGGKVFCIYGLTTKELAALKRTGTSNEAEPVLFALDVRSGKTLWHKPLGKSYLTWLAYSQQYDVLLQTIDFRVAQNGLETAYRGADGTILWQVDAERHVGPPHILSGDRVIPQSGGAYELFTGRPVLRANSMTGAQVPLDYHRTWHFGGCNYAVGSTNLLTFRNGTGGYCDLASGGGTGFLGGDRTGCRNSLIAADGVLNSPNISGCGCNFPMRGASMALVHDEQADAWTYTAGQLGVGPIERLGLNLGAPGDRKAESGTTWLDHPSVGGPSPGIALQSSPAEVRTLRVHPSRFKSGALPWVAASGLEGLTSVTVPVVHYPRGESFSARWSGKIKPAHTETYTFHARIDDGARIWIGGKLLIDRWKLPRALRWTFPYTPYVPGAEGYVASEIELKKDELYDIKVEYFKRSGSADMLLLWSSPSTPKERIPGDVLFTSDMRPGVDVTWFEDLDLKGRAVTEVVPTIGGRWGEKTPPALAGLPVRPEVARSRRFTVRLHFAELAEVEPGERVFDVAIQGKQVLRNLDIAKEAGGPFRQLVKEFTGITAADELTIEMSARTGKPLLNGIEIVRER